MTENNIVSQLRKILVDLNLQKEDIRRIANDTDPQLVTAANFNSSIVNYWDDILREAMRREKIEALITVVEDEDYRSQAQRLRRIWKQYLDPQRRLGQGHGPDAPESEPILEPPPYLNGILVWYG